MGQLSVLRKFPGELHILPVVDAADQPLGWAVCVLIDIDHAGTSVDYEQQAADIQQAEFLVLRHCISQDEAFIVKQGIQTFIRENRKMLADFAFPRDFWEWNVLTSTQAMDVSVTLLKGSDLNKFLTDQHPLKCKREDWCPIFGFIRTLRANTGIDRVEVRQERIRGTTLIGDGLGSSPPIDRAKNRPNLATRH